MKTYTVAFIFTPDFKKVWLIEKQKPEWQKGRLNGIGGKVEDGETNYDSCIREIKEEGGVDINFLNRVGVMQGTNNDDSGFECHIFTGTTTEQLITKEKEKISLYDVMDVKNHRAIDNVPMLIETCIYFMTGDSNFKQLKMIY